MARKKKRRIIATADFETDPFEFNADIQPFSAGFYDGSAYHDFWGADCVTQLLNFLFEVVCDYEDNEKLIIYFHNGGKFDLFFMLEHLDPDLFIINGRIAKCTLFDGKIEIRDSYLILPLPLSSHAKDSIDYDKFKRDVREYHKTEILNYQRTDCIYLHEWVSMFIGQFGFNLTLAGTAFKELKKTSYTVGNTYSQFDELFRNFYFGGRVQCFEVGAFENKEITYLDLNSAYPDVMRRKHWGGSQYLELDTLPDCENGSWYAEIRAESRGALPIRVKENSAHKLYFPDDGKERTFFATGWEIQKGIETNTLKINKVVNAYRPIFLQDFVEYVAKFFAMKFEADTQLEKCVEGTKDYRYWSAMRTFAKLMLNSCYGKFGQDGREFEKFCITEFGESPQDKRYEWEPYAMHSTHWIFSRPDPVERFYNVATAGSITGAVRANLWGSILSCDRPIYSDTDSIINIGGYRLDTGNDLGQWKIEEQCSDAYIAQRKMYGLRCVNYGNFGPVDKTKKACKGVKLEFDEIKRGVLSGRSIETVRDAPAYSLKYGRRYFTRKVDFENIQKNACRNPIICG